MSFSSSMRGISLLSSFKGNPQIVKGTLYQSCFFHSQKQEAPLKQRVSHPLLAQAASTKSAQWQGNGYRAQTHDVKA